MSAFDEINDATGFANGEKFECESQVRAYFTVDAIAYMFNGDSPSQDFLDSAAKEVIENGWHCADWFEMGDSRRWRYDGTEIE